MAAGHDPDHREQPWSRRLAGGPLAQSLFTSESLPATPAKARKMAKFATPDNVAAVRGILAEHPAVAGADAVQTALVVALLLLADDDEARGALQEIESDARERRDAEVMRRLWETSGLLAGSPLADAVHSRSDAWLRELPTVVNAAWAQRIGLTVPTDRPWELRWAVPLGPGDDDSTRLRNLGLAAHVAWEPGKGVPVGTRRDATVVDRTFALRCSRTWWGDGPGDFTSPDSRYDIRCFGAGSGRWPEEFRLAAVPDRIDDAPAVLAEMARLTGLAPQWDEVGFFASPGVKGHKAVVPAWLQSGPA